MQEKRKTFELVFKKGLKRDKFAEELKTKCPLVPQKIWA